jgi:hypothetical protein
MSANIVGISWARLIERELGSAYKFGPSARYAGQNLDGHIFKALLYLSSINNVCIDLNKVFNSENVFFTQKNVLSRIFSAD